MNQIDNLVLIIWLQTGITFYKVNHFNFSNMEDVDTWLQSVVRDLLKDQKKYPNIWMLQCLVLEENTPEIDFVNNAELLQSINSAKAVDDIQVPIIKIIESLYQNYQALQKIGERWEKCDEADKREYIYLLGKIDSMLLVIASMTKTELLLKDLLKKLSKISKVVNDSYLKKIIKNFSK